MKTTKGTKSINTYSTKCEICGKEITGYSESVLDYYLKVHNDTQHKKIGVKNGK